VSSKKQPAVKESCESCGAYLHCCLNCKFHAPHAHNQCLIPTTDWVGDRAGCNFCDEFTFADAKTGGGKKDKASGVLDQLLGGESEEKKTVDDFKKLFGD
jgi:hypothetical protein